MLTAKGSETISLYPLGALAKTKCIHLQKLTDSKSKYKKVLRTHRNILAETQATTTGLLFILENQRKKDSQHYTRLKPTCYYVSYRLSVDGHPVRRQFMTAICISKKENNNIKEVATMAEKLYTCYETNQTMSEKDWFLYYLTSDEIDKTEYRDFSDWWHDMRKSGVIEEV